MPGVNTPQEDYKFGSVGVPGDRDLESRRIEIKRWEWEHILRHQISHLVRVVSFGEDGQATIVVKLHKYGGLVSTVCGFCGRRHP